MWVQMWLENMSADFSSTILHIVVVNGVILSSKRITAELFKNSTHNVIRILFIKAADFN